MFCSPFEQFKTHAVFFFPTMILSNNIILIFTLLVVSLSGFYFLFSTEKTNDFSLQAISQVYNFLFGTIKNYLGHSVNFYFPFYFLYFVLLFFVI